MWLVSRMVIVVGLSLGVLFQPVDPNAAIDFTMLSRWDSGWYHKIATFGYEYAPDGQAHSIAFFPLFPLLVATAMKAGLDFFEAGALVNNLAFLGALMLLYRWMKERYSLSIARWSVAALAWCPFSLYGSVIYTEGLFLLLTTAALRAFDQRKHVQAAVFGALATATRITGLALIPSMLIVAWREKRSSKAYLAACCVGLGIAAFAAYCLWRFGNPVAFLDAQKGWRSSLGLDWLSWLKVLTFGVLGPIDSGNGFIKVIMLAGGGALLWVSRAVLPPVALAYAVFSLALILFTGTAASIERYIYGIVSITIAFGLYFSAKPRRGLLLLAYFGLLLAVIAFQYVRYVWIA